jgi:hypothetical protein
VNRTESTANIAQPSANPHRTAPVRALSSAGMNGAATRSRAATSPVANEPATIQPMCPLAVGGEAGCSEVGVWSTRELAMVINPSANCEVMRPKQTVP